MTPEQQTLVKDSFAKLAPISDVAAVLFYNELFERDPALRGLFKPDMSEQRQKLMAMLATAVANLGEWEKITAAVQALGRRHVGYGVKPSDYQTVGDALIATLAKGLGAEFTPEVRLAWLACIEKVAGVMLTPA
jgi:hemoglobin-like flavoprotein